MSVTCESRTFWWDLGRPADAVVEPLQAVIFDLDGALADIERYGQRIAFEQEYDLFGHSVLSGDVTPRVGLDDLVNSLYFAGIRVAVVSRGDRAWVDPLVRQLIGDGIAQTIVTADDLTRPGRTPDLYGHALWELGLAPEHVLAVAGTPRGAEAARAAKLATLVLTSGSAIGGGFTGAAEVRCSYDGLLAGDCESLHRRWWAGR